MLTRLAARHSVMLPARATLLGAWSGGQAGNFPDSGDHRAPGHGSLRKGTIRLRQPESITRIDSAGAERARSRATVLVRGIREHPDTDSEGTTP